MVFFLSEGKVEKREKVADLLTRKGPLALVGLSVVCSRARFTSFSSSSSLSTSSGVRECRGGGQEDAVSLSGQGRAIGVGHEGGRREGCRENSEGEGRR